MTLNLTGPGVTRPVLRYHGGKWRLAPWIISRFPPHRVYVEPFGGAASVLLRKPRSYAEVFNDLDGEIVNLFRVVREQPAELTRAVTWTPYSRDEYRASFTPADDPLERARRLIVRSFMGHGSDSHNRESTSGFRANAFRNHTTPSHDWANYPPTIRRVAKRLRGVIIENKDALSAIEANDGPETLHYLDPPYVHATRRLATDTRGNGYSCEMTDADHERLAERLHGIEGMAVLSGYRGVLYERLYQGWPSIERATIADGAKPRTEVLWFNAAAWTAQGQGTLFSNSKPHDAAQL